MDAHTDAALRRARDRRLLPRVYLRLLVVLALLASAEALPFGGGLPVLAGARAVLPSGWLWAAAVVHLAAGLALLIPSTRRAGAATGAALLLGWVALMGARARVGPAVTAGALLVAALASAAPADEGPWRTREPVWPAEVGHALAILVLGLCGRWLLGPTLHLVLPVGGALVHRRLLRRFGPPPSLVPVGLLWALAFWLAPGAGWALLSTGPVAPAAMPGWPGTPPGSPGTAAWQGVACLAALAALARATRIRAGVAVAAGASAFLIGAVRDPGDAVLPAALAALGLLALPTRGRGRG